MIGFLSIVLVLTLAAALLGYFLVGRLNWRFGGIPFIVLSGVYFALVFSVARLMKGVFE